jgi:predicted site-specific integrase-resolvase
MDTSSFDKLVPRKIAAQLLGVAPQTLAVWACTGRYSLPYIKIGKRVRYRLTDIENFIKAHRFVRELS